MPEDQPTATLESPMLRPAKKRTSAASRVHDMAARFYGYLELNGGLAQWQAYAASTDLGEAYDPELEAAVFEGLDAVPPPGWKPWNFAQLELAEQASMQVKSVRGIQDGPGGDTRCFEPRAAKPSKPKKVEEAKDLRSMFERRLAALRADPTPLQKPWMTNYTLQLVTSVEQLQAWVTRIQSDVSLWFPNPDGVTMPVVAMDTETFGTRTLYSGLDTRLVNGRPQLDCAGICLCADGRVALYAPLNHVILSDRGPEFDQPSPLNLDRAAVRRILQPLFDTSYLVFFNSKFDREVGRLTLGLSFRDFPYFEDVQNDNFLLDPKADLDEEVSDFGGNGLKDLAERDLGIDQIELSTLTEVKAQYLNPKLGKKTYKNFMAPFSWVPTDLAVLYAAPDALTTWLLWKKKHEQAQKMRFPFKLDHLLVDSLTWIERQRFKIDIQRLQDTISLHHRKMEQFKRQLSELSGIPDFNPGSPNQLADVLFSPDKLGFKKGKLSEKTGAASTDKTVVDDLKKAHPNHPFLIALSRYRSYASLHPASLEYDPRDMSARMFFKQCTVAGGRLAAMGGGLKEGKGKDDGGFGLNPQAIKGVKGLHVVEGREILFPDSLAKLAEVLDPAWLSEVSVEQLHESVLKRSGEYIKVEAPDLVNGVAHYMGRWWSFRPDDVLQVRIPEAAQNEHSFAARYELAVDPLRQKVDSNEVINLRGLFVAPDGYTLCVVDYSNIEMRVAANVSREPKFIDEFLTGSGDLHTLTAKSVFPEFSTTKDKVLRKELRSLAKIINFALLYGGTEHAIFMNMKTQDPTITKEKATGMVEAYWAAVPLFADWTYRMRKIARETLTCTTPDGRKIDFHSVLAAEGLHAPSKEDQQRVRSFWNLRNRGKELGQQGRKDEAAKVAEAVDKIWKDDETGVRNASEYKKMVGKFERVAVNAPLQGLAGDLMRRALTLIHRWAERSGVEGALLVHASVHDEVDFCIKNEYVPYVLPRITRLMKLRDMHKAAKWPVPIECDCEYGTSWDVKQHLTGDDGHVVAGYTRIPGLEGYIPALFDPEVEQQLLDCAGSGDPDRVKEACAYLREALHPRVAEVIARVEASWETPAEARRCLIAACQLHEYWCIDEHEDEASDESLASYMERMGLQPFPGLGEHVLTSVRVEELPPLEPTPSDQPSSEPEFQAEPEQPEAPLVAPAQVSFAPAGQRLEAELRPDPGPAVALLDEPEPEPRPAARRQVPLYKDGLPVLRDLDQAELAELQLAVGCRGHRTLLVYYMNGPFPLRNTRLEALPAKFQQMVDADDE